MDRLDLEPEAAGAEDDASGARSASLSSVIERELIRKVAAGELTVGDRLNEMHLAKRFGTSRGPVREAARSLTARGLAEMVPNRGVFIRAIPVPEALEIYDLRAAVFGLAGRLLTDLVTDEMLTTLRGFLDEMDVHAANSDFERYYPANLAFHAYLIDAVGNATLKREYYALVDKIHLCRAKSLVHADGLLVSNREHRDMVDSLASGDRLRAQESFFRHVERAKRRFERASNA